MEALAKGISRVFGVIAAAAVVILMVAIVTDVVFRWFTGRSLPSMVEISETALVVSIFLGLAWALVTGAHVAVTLVADRLGARANYAFGLITWTLCTLIGIWFVVAAAGRAMTATGLNETRMGLVVWPLWPLRWVIVVGFLALTLGCAVNLVRAVRGRQPLGGDAIPEVGGVDEVAPVTAGREA